MVAGREVSPGDVSSTEKLMRYWTRGAGAAKIGWGVPHDFDRCVSLLRKYFPKDPKGLCANLHKRAIGVWPGQEDGGRGHHGALELDEALAADGFEALVAAAAAAIDTTKPMHYMMTMAPIGQWTDENTPRRFAAGAMTNRDLPLPLMWQRVTGGQPHAGSQVVGRITHIEYGDGAAIALGDIFPSDKVDGVAEFVTLAHAGAIGPSVDPVAYAGEAAQAPDGRQGVEFSSYRVKGATMVATPAFPSRMLIWNATGNEQDDDPDDDAWLTDDDGYQSLMDENLDGDEPQDPSLVAAVLATGWENYPVAERRAPWKADDAIKRISQWAAGDPGKLSEVFLWRDRTGDPKDISSYRLPVADINKEGPVLVYHAVYAAAALINGAHGGLPGIPDVEKGQLRTVVNKMYDKFGIHFGQKLPSPWGRGGGQTQEGRMGTVDEDEALFGVNSSGWSSLPIAKPDTVWRAGAATKRLAARAGSGDSLNWQKYGQGFLWHANSPQHRGDFKLPICDVINGKLTIIPRAVAAVASVLGGGRGGVDIPSGDKGRIQGIVETLTKRIKDPDRDGDDDETAKGDTDNDRSSLYASIAPLAPPKEWFHHPEPGGPTKMTVTEQGQVFGHIATWDTCHLGIQGKCITVPRSGNDYADFHVGQVMTADGNLIDVGHITAGGGHAPLHLTADATRAHYDSTSQQTAIGRVVDGTYGPFFAGALVPEATPEQAAMLRRSPISGDWRNVNGSGLSLVAALCVNRPGFQIKPAFSVDDDDVVSLVAAGVVLDSTEVTVDEIVDAVENRANQRQLQYSRAAKFQDLLQRERAAKYHSLMGE